jgi:hypothetical protein
MITNNIKIYNSFTTFTTNLLNIMIYCKYCKCAKNIFIKLYFSYISRKFHENTFTQ